MTLDEAIARLRELNEPVPTPMPLPTEDDIAAAEEELGVKFPADYRTFLLKASDVSYGALEPATVSDPESHTHLPAIAQEAWEELELPRKLLPICEDNGDYYCLNKKGEVVYWSHDGESEDLWPDLAAWINDVWIEES